MNNHKDKSSLRLIVAAVCMALPFLFSLIPYTITIRHNSVFWNEVETAGSAFIFVGLPSIAFICLLPVLMRGSIKQRFLAAALALPTGLLAYQGWEGFIMEHIIMGY